MRITPKLFYILIAYLPFQIALNITEGVDLASGRVLILFLFLFVLFEAAKEKQKLTKFDLAGLSLIFFFIFAALSLTQAEIPEWGLRKLLFFASIFPLYFITKHILTFNINILKIIRILVGSAVIISAFGIIQFVSQFIFGIDTIISLQSKYIAPLFYGRSFGEAVAANPSWLVNVGGKTLLRAFSIFPDPRNFSLYLGMILPLSVFLLINRCFNVSQNLKRKAQSAKQLELIEEPKRRKTQNILMYALPPATIFAGILLSFSRSAYIALIISFLAVTILNIRLIKKTIRNSKLNINQINLRGGTGYALYAVVIFSFLLLVFSFFSPIGSRFLSSFNLQEGSNLGRLEMWKAGWQTFAASPFFGVGLGNFPLQVERFSEYRQAINAHNTYLDIASEIGIFGLLAWLVLIFGTIKKLTFSAQRLAFSEDKKNNLRNLQLNAIRYTLYASIIWCAAQSFFEVSVYSPINLAILMVILGISGALFSHNDPSVNITCGIIPDEK